MASEETQYKIDESTYKNPFLLKKIKEYGSLTKLARKIGISPSTLSWALNNSKYSSKASKIIIAKYFGKDTLEIF